MKGVNISLWLVCSSIAWLCLSDILPQLFHPHWSSSTPCSFTAEIQAHQCPLGLSTFPGLFLKEITHRGPSFPHFTSFPWANIFLDYSRFSTYAVLLTPLHRKPCTSVERNDWFFCCVANLSYGLWLAFLCGGEFCIETIVLLFPKLLHTCNLWSIWPFPWLILKSTTIYIVHLCEGFSWLGLFKWDQCV